MTYTNADAAAECHYDENGKLHDPAPGVPAVRMASGSTCHYQHGVRHDPAPGAPAARLADGSTCHYQHGKRHDPAPGVPAARWSDGSTGHYQRGKLHDPAPGVPAERLADGSTGHYQHGYRMPDADASARCVWLAEDEGYRLIRDHRGRYLAGCRDFDRAQALAHWEHTRPAFFTAISNDNGGSTS